MNTLNFDKFSKKIIIPKGTKTILDEAFMDFEELEEIIIPDSVTYIGNAAFKGCKKLKKITLPKKLSVLESYAFSECSSLEEITIPPTLHYLSPAVFSHCTNLKKLNIHDNINYIEDYALYNCKNLENFNIPKSTTSLGRMALMGCEKIKEITIPKNMNCIETGALALMTSLKKITVAEGNENYITANDNTVLISREGMIIQYAIACTNPEFTAGYYMEDYETYTDEFGLTKPIPASELIYNIADYAFAGAKHLKKITLNSEITSIGHKTFSSCDNLKTLEIFHSAYGDSFLLNIFKPLDEKIDTPFEEVIIKEGIKTLCEGLNELFKNITSISLPESLEHIGKDVLNKSKKLKRVNLPSKLKMVLPNTFDEETELYFPTFGLIKAKDFNMLQTKTSDDYYKEKHDKGNIRIFSLKDGTYYVKIDDFDTIKVNIDEIRALSNNSKSMEENPDNLIAYLNKLLGINREHYSIMRNIWTNPKLQTIFDKFASDIDYIEEIASNKTSRAIREIFDNSGICDEILFSNLIMRCLNKEEIIKVLENYNPSIDRFFRLCKINEDKDISLDIDKLIAYCSLLEKYQVYDKFLYNPVFFQNVSIKNQELLIKHFNKNLKHLLKNSKTTNDLYGENLNDLLKLCQALGVFAEDETLSQQTTTFINEKIFDEKQENKVISHDIHTVFGEIEPREEIDYEFIKFFIENYNELININKKETGLISRIYNSFRDISKTSTSHRGEQRHLKVTIDKCLDYFLAQKFEGVTEENKELAYLLKKYYSEPFALHVGEKILIESYKAPRNIFSEVLYDKNNNPIYSYDKKEDLVDDSNQEYTYHWLPKQDYDNLILGKYCSCCAHILGAGAGIMRASMILDNCQNLVIRNHNNEIIAKMTIYVNKKEGYAVFNTAEINTLYRERKKEICDSFLRGVKAFIERYNQNNKIKIHTVSIGEYRNTLKEELGNIEIPLYETPNYSEYGYTVNNSKYGDYDGDSKEKQLLVLKK